MRTISSITENKNWQKSMATFLANEINATDRDITGPTEQVQIMFPLKDKNIYLINNAGYLKTFFLWRRWINNQRKSNSVWCNTPHWNYNRAYLLRTEITKSHLNNRVCQHCGVKTSTVTPPFFSTFLISPCLVTSTYQVSLEIYGGFFYKGITLRYM